MKKEHLLNQSTINLKNIRKNIQKNTLIKYYNKYLINLFFYLFSMIEVSNETKEYLKSNAFNNWKFEDAEMLLLAQQMFIDLNLVSTFAIKVYLLI